MKKTLLILLIFTMAVCAFGESSSFIPTTKIKAAVINIDNNTGAMTSSDQVFDFLSNNKYLYAGHTSYDMNYSFYNPKGINDRYNTYSGNIEQPGYWRLDLDRISPNVLNQYDILLLPLEGTNYNNFKVSGNDKYDEKILSIIRDWIQEGGLLWVDNNGYTGPLEFLPIYDLLNAGSGDDYKLNNNSPIKSYPFVSSNAGWGTTGKSLNLDTFSGMNLFPNAVEMGGDRNTVFNGILKIGDGKLIYTSNLINSKTNVYKWLNLLFNAFSPNMNNSSVKTPAILGNSLSEVEKLIGEKPLVANGHIYYVNGSALYVDGFNLCVNVSGKKPEKSLSQPALMGDSDIVVYDEEGSLFICTGLEFSNNGSLDNSNVTWMKVYSESENNSCSSSIKFSPVVSNYWVYYVNDYGNLNIVYTKEVDSDKVAKYAWITEGYASNTGEVISCPLITSKVNSYGEYVTEVTWLMRNETSDAGVYNGYMCSVPVFVTGELSYRQPFNSEPYTQMQPNLSKFPTLTGASTFLFAPEADSSPEAVFTKIIANYNNSEHILQAYDKTHTSNWDYKINYKANGVKLNGYIMLNVNLTAKDGLYYFNSTSTLGETVPTTDCRFRLSYIPKYTKAIRSTIQYGSYLSADKQNIKNTINGIVYNVKRDNDSTDNKGELTYINKETVSNNQKQGTYSRYAAWSYLPHTGFTNLLCPTGLKINAYSFIDWGFGPYINQNAAKVYVNGISTYGDNVFVNLTASLNNTYLKSAVVCLDSNAEPEIRIVDENRNPVCLRYIQKNKKGEDVEVAYTLKVYQPSVYDTDISDADRNFTVPITNPGNGRVVINALNKFKKGTNKNQLITTSLPIFVSLEYNLDLNNSSVQRKYLPVLTGTNDLFDISSYNNSLPDSTMPISDGTHNDDVKLYVDLSDWNQVKWYSVLPGNVETFGEPICSGENVIVFGDEKDELTSLAQNKVFTINPRGVEYGAKVRENNISVANINNDIALNDQMKLSFGMNKVALASNGKVSVLENNKSLIIDGSSLMEIDASGKMAWRLTKVEDNYNDDEDTNFILNNPIKAKYVFDNNHIAIADAGKKAIFVIDKNGYLKTKDINNNDGDCWIFDKFEDKYGIIRKGAEFDLGYMTDFVFWTEAAGSNTLNHFLVADNSNNRILDLIIETDTNGNVVNNSFDSRGYVMPYLNWTTYDIITGNKTNFVSVDITEKVKDKDDNEMRAVVCGVSNYNLNEKNGIRRSKGGSVVMYAYRMNSDNYNSTSQEDYLNRLGRMYDCIGQQNDSIYSSNNSYNITNTDRILAFNSIKYNFNGLKKVVIENLDGRNYNSDDIKPYSNLQLLICDESGVILYHIDGDGSWNYDADKAVFADYFGANDPSSDTSINTKISSYGAKPRFKPFSTEYYNRISASGSNKTTYAPLKAPIVPIDVKVLPSGNWLILNGFSGKVNYSYKNPYDQITYDIESDYFGEALEFTFGNDGVELVWASNQLESYAIDDYLNVNSNTEEDINNWNRILDEMDGRVYSPDNSPFGYDNNIIGGFKIVNKKLKSPRSIDR